MKTRAPLWRNQTGESIPSLDTDPQLQDAASPQVLWSGQFRR